jgi:hypothetical protein
MPKTRYSIQEAADVRTKVKTQDAGLGMLLEYGLVPVPSSRVMVLSSLTGSGAQSRFQEQSTEQ